MNIRRDRWGRALVPHPLPDGKPAPHKRPSSVAMKIADRFNLERWQQRMVAKGVALRPDLLALAHSLDPDDGDDKRQLDEVVAKAREAAGSARGANTGTALHAYCRQIVEGVDVTPLDTYAADLEAFRRLLDDHGIEPSTSEEFVVWSDRLIAGTRDLTGTLDGRRVVLDLKTGQHNPADFSMVEYAAQLACYANAGHAWDGDTATELEPVDTETAYIIWLPAGQGHAELVAVDISKGVRWVDLALEVDAAQKDRNVARTVAPVTSNGHQKVTSPHAVKVGELRRRLTTLTTATACTPDDVVASWPADAPPLTDPAAQTDDTLDRIEGMVMLLEMAHGATTATDVSAVVARLQALPADLLAAVEAEAVADGVPNLLTGRVTEAQVDTVTGLVKQAEREAANRHAQVVAALSPLTETQAAAIVEWACEDADTVPPIERLMELQAERVVALAHLYSDPDAGPEGLTDYIVDRCGSKSEALSRGRDCAQRHGLPVPRSTADVAGDRVLVALVTNQNREGDSL